MIGGPEKLVVHVKTYQDISHSASSPEDMKGTPRYLCLTRKDTTILFIVIRITNLKPNFLEKKSTMRLIKVKKNHKGGFDISKTWSLNDIKQIEIANVMKWSRLSNNK
jgi:hypothetical protein